MARYTLTYTTYEDELGNNAVEQKYSFSSRKALAEAYEQMKGMVVAGQKLVGRDNKDALVLHHCQPRTLQKKFADWCDELTRRSGTARKRLVKWTEKVAAADDPAYELAWGEEELREAAIVTVLHDTLAFVNKHFDELGIEGVLGQLRTFAEKKAMYHVRYRSTSTNLLRNIMDDKVAAEWAKLSEELPNA